MKKLIILFFIILCSASSRAQERIFIFDNFETATVQFKNGAKNVSLMNYDANGGKMYFIQGEELMELQGVENIANVTFGERKFVQEKSDFLELVKLENGDVNILWRIHKIHEGYKGAYGLVTQSGGARKITLEGNFGMGGLSGAGGGMYNGTYGVNTEDGATRFDVWKAKSENVYYIIKDGKTIKIKRTKDLQKAFPEKKEDIKNFMDENNINMLNADMALKLINYVLQK
ncbi:MAG: hypothetical protein HUJ97_05830 [Bacteroidales bacterium]|nr:hypothetical protein [Bacteroidales bacterium]